MNARQALKRAIARGDVIAGPCEIGVDCGGRLEGHHDDYKQPLKARFFCAKHHRTHAHGGSQRKAAA